MGVEQKKGVPNVNRSPHNHRGPNVLGSAVRVHHRPEEELTMKTITVDMYHERETKGTHRYDAVDAINGATNAIYLRKAAFDGPPPAKIRLTVQELD